MIFVLYNSIIFTSEKLQFEPKIKVKCEERKLRSLNIVLL